MIVKTCLLLYFHEYQFENLLPSDIILTVENAAMNFLLLHSPQNQTFCFGHETEFFFKLNVWVEEKCFHGSSGLFQVIRIIDDARG